MRRELGVQTVMNMVGPLANPASAGRQVVGVADARRMALIAGALRELDAVHALVVHGAGMDEMSPFGDTQVIEIRNGELTEWTIDPRHFGFGDGLAAMSLPAGRRARMRPPCSTCCAATGTRRRRPRWC